MTAPDCVPVHAQTHEVPASEPAQPRVYTVLETDTLESLISIVQKHYQLYPVQGLIICGDVLSSRLLGTVRDYIEGLRFTLCVWPTSSVTRYPIPRGPNYFAESYFAELTDMMLRANILDDDEKLLLGRNPADVTLPSRAWNARPDYVIDHFGRRMPDMVFKSSHCGRFPHLVIERAFAQKYDNPVGRGGFLQETEYWLKHKHGEVKCVLICCIVEESNRDIPGPSGGAGEVHNDTTIANENRDNLKGGTDCSTTNACEFTLDSPRWMNTLVNRYVRPVSAFVEMWRFDGISAKMMRSGPRVVCLPFLQLFS